MIYTCDFCGKEFRRRPSLRKHGHVFCCVQCAGAFRRGKSGHVNGGNREVQHHLGYLADMRIVKSLDGERVG